MAKTDSFDGNSLMLVDTPLVRLRLARLRNRHSSCAEFRELTHQLAVLLAVQALHDFPIREETVETPLASTDGAVADAPLIMVPILRAGLALLNGLLPIYPDARVGHLGMFRDESTLQPVQYYSKIPVLDSNARVLLLDPMLATGNSAVAAVDLLKTQGATHITFLCLLCAPEGLSHLQTAHPDVRIVTAAVDSHLNEIGYIVPGLGDAGDRYFGT